MASLAGRVQRVRMNISGFHSHHTQRHLRPLRVIGQLVGAVGSVVVATLVRLSLDSYLGDNQAYGTYYLAVALIAWLAGWWPALITMVLGYGAGDWFFVPPRHALGIEDLGHLADLFMYLLVTGTTIALITQLRLIHESLRRSEQRLRVTAETVPDILFATGPDGKCDYVSSRFFEFTGYPSEEALGAGWTRALHPDDKQMVLDKWESSVRTGENFEAEYRLCNVSGACRWFMGRARPVKDEHRRIVRWVGSCTDIELQKQAANLLQESVNKRTAELQHSVQELQGFSYGLIHDMRAPLRAMTSFIQLAEAGLRDAPPQSLDFLRRVKIAAQRMDHLITDAFDYSIILLGNPPLTSVDMAAILRSILESYPNLQPPDVNVTIHLDSLRVRGNEAALTQVLSNLLGNAVKFVAPGVHPRVRIWAERRRSATSPQSDHAIIWIEDNGIGIARSDQERIFGMFERVYSNQQYTGTGIGLAIVKKAMERMGGKVGVESEVNRGSRFWLELPLAT